MGAIETSMFNFVCKLPDWFDPQSAKIAFSDKEYLGKNAIFIIDPGMKPHIYNHITGEWDEYGY